MSSPQKKLKVAVVGASGAVGRAVVAILKERAFPTEPLRTFASPKSAAFHEVLTESTSFADLDIVFFTAGSAVSEKYVFRAASHGALVIDNASLFRMREDVPLVIPEINAETLTLAKKTRVVANPNCTTAQIVMVLKPLHDAFGVERVVVSSYQAVSGRGQAGIEEFKRQIAQFASGKQPTAQTFPHPIAFNCLPHIDSFQADGFTGEERKVMQETRKILGLPELHIQATCVRVPVMNGHSASVSVETKRPVSVSAAHEVLRKMSGVTVVDEPGANRYPLATEASGKDDVFVGRVRQDPSLPKGRHGLLFWVVADNLRKGAALNAVQIAEAAVARGI